MPALAIGVGVVLVDLMRGEQQTTDHLKSVATLKEAEIDVWLDNLQSDLDSVVFETDGNRPCQLDSARIAFPRSARYCLHQSTSAFPRVIEQRHLFQEVFLLDPRGEVVVSTDTTQEGKLYNNQPYFQEGIKGTLRQRTLLLCVVGPDVHRSRPSGV